MEGVSQQPIFATVLDGRIILDEAHGWADGSRVKITPLAPSNRNHCLTGHAIIVGFGLAGRYVADLLDQTKIPYTIVERNVDTVDTQRGLGRTALPGNGCEVQTLLDAGIETASSLVLTIPDEEAVLQAVDLARRIRPDIYIMARTNYASQGMRAAQLGADEVIKAEQAVAIQFYERLNAILCHDVSTAQVEGATA